MVGEFPELQGTMGRYYALNDGEDGEVAVAIEDHYRPRFAGDELPRNPVGALVAVADKLETLVGLFAHRPAAHRRQGPVRAAPPCARRAAHPDRAAADAVARPGGRCGHRGACLACRGERRDRRAERPRAADPRRRCSRSSPIAWRRRSPIAATAPPRSARCSPTTSSGSSREVEPRLLALRQFAALPRRPALAAANKRVGNILKKASEPIGGTVDPALLREPAEAALARRPAARSAPLRRGGARDRATTPGRCAPWPPCSTPVDAFFDSVMVNVDDAALRANRLALLGRAARGDEPRRRPVAAGRLTAAIAAMKLVILDRDGTINEDRDDYVKSADEWVPMPGALEAIARLNHAGWHTVIATNQSGLARGLFDMAALNAIHARMNRELAEVGGRIDAIFFCPHGPDDGCRCRKPLPGMFETIADRYGIDLARGAPGRRLAARPAGRRRRRLRAALRAAPARRRGSTPPSSPRCRARCRRRRSTPTSPASCSELLHDERVERGDAAEPDSVFGVL